MTAQQTIPNPLTIPGFLSRHESWVIRRIGSQCSKDRNHFIKLYVQGNVKCISRWLISPWDKRLSTWLRPQPYYYCLINISCTPTGNEKSAVILRHHSGGSLLFYSNYPSASQQTETMTLATGESQLEECMKMSTVTRSNTPVSHFSVQGAKAASPSSSQPSVSGAANERQCAPLFQCIP